MVAIIAERLPMPQSATARPRRRAPYLSLVPPQPAESMRELALKTWLMSDSVTTRGYTLFLSESGCEVHGASRGLKVGDKVFVKIETQKQAAPTVCKARVLEASRGRAYLVFEELTPCAFDAIATVTG